MPELDFMIVADYVRVDAGVMHMIAAAIDTVYTPAVPSTRMLGLGIRLFFTPAETRHEHPLEVVFQDSDGHRIAQINAMIPAQPIPPGRQPGMPIGALLPINMQLPLPAYGVYSFELLIHGNHLKSAPLIISPPVAPAGGVVLGHPGNA
jgi:hypothetical protein